MNFYLVFFLLINNIIFGTVISGSIKNSLNGKSIPNANIYFSENNLGSVSDPYGNFSIELPDGKYTINVSNIGFKSHTSVVIILSLIHI